MPKNSSSNPDRIDIHVGGRIRDLRKQNEITQGELSEAIGITYQQIQKYEKGINRVSASTLFRICRVLNVEPNAIFAGL